MRQHLASLKNTHTHGLNQDEYLAIAAYGAEVDGSMPLLGFVADCWRLLTANSDISSDSDGWPRGLRIAYEDAMFRQFRYSTQAAAAAKALLLYEDENRLRAGAWLISRICSNLGIRRHPAQSSDVSRCRRGTLPDGIEPAPPKSMVDVYRELVAALQTGEAILETDAAMLASGAAALRGSQRVAAQTILEVATKFKDEFQSAPRRVANRRGAAKSDMDESQTYPIGGYDGIGNRGSLESVAPSELVFMRQQACGLPLFSIRYALNELLYFQRREAKVTRPVLTFFFLFDTTKLAKLRYKDKNLPCQQGLMLLAWVLAIQDRLTAWYKDRGISFIVLFVGKPEEQCSEQELMTLLCCERSAAEQVWVGRVALPVAHQVIIATQEQSKTTVANFGVQSTSLSEAKNYSLEAPSRIEKANYWSAWVEEGRKLLDEWF